MRPNAHHFIKCLLTCAAMQIGLRGGAVARSAEQETLEITVDETRPLAAAAEVLEKRHSVIITYEDPPYRHASDVSDVTLKVRKDLDQYPPGKAPRVLIPRPASLRMSYVAGARAVDISSVLSSLLQTHAQLGNPGVFEVEQVGKVFHIIPTGVKSDSGQLAKARSILDTRISFEETDRTAFNALDVIVQKLRKTAPPEVKQIGCGHVPLNLLRQKTVRMGASAETARTVLARLLAEFKVKLSWQLFYDPGLKWYALNIHAVPDVPATNPAPAESKVTPPFSDLK